MNGNEKSKRAQNAEMPVYRAVTKYCMRDHKHNGEVGKEMGIIDIVRV
jgi:hypothetical protein